MKARMRMLRTMYVLPIVLMVLRIILTGVVMFANPLQMRWRFIQLIVGLEYCVWLFLYCKLYNDGDPVVTLMLPTIVHFALIFAFKREVMIIPFLPLILVDILFLVFKGIKGSMYPFEVEDPRLLDDLAGFNEEELDGE